MCDIIEYRNNSFRIKYENYESEYYSDINDLRLQDIIIIKEDSKNAHIPFDIYIFKKFNDRVIARKSIKFRVDTVNTNIGEYWIIKSGEDVIIKWVVFDYDIGYLFINDILKCSPLNIITEINEVMWKDFDYDNNIIQWLIHSLNKFCRKNINMTIPSLGVEITQIIWDYIICDFDNIEF